MHDEAVVTFSDAADQLGLGARLAAAAFGPAAAARGAWSIDPFGHGGTQASISAQMGHASMFYGRLDFQESAWQVAHNATEYVWRGSKSLGASAQILAGANVHGYDPPTLTDSGHPIFEWDVVSDTVNKPALVFGPLQPHPELDGYNVGLFVNATVELALRQAAYILPDEEDGTVNIAWQMGTDFNYVSGSRAPAAKINNPSAPRPRFTL